MCVGGGGLCKGRRILAQPFLCYLLDLDVSLKLILNWLALTGIFDFSDSMCVVHLRGHKFQVGAGGRTLKRVTDTTTSGRIQPALSRVHIGGLTYSRTANGQYELTRVHQARAVVRYCISTFLYFYVCVTSYD